MTSGGIPESRSVEKLWQNLDLCVEAVKREERHQTRECPRMPANAPRMSSDNGRECPRKPPECPPKMAANAPRMPTRANNNLCFLPVISASSGSLGSSPHPKAEHGDGADRGGRFADPRPFVSASTPLSYDRCVGDRGGRLADPRPFVSASITLSSDRCVGRSVVRSYIGFATT